MAAPTNDECAGATVLGPSLPVVVTQDVREATSNVADPVPVNAYDTLDPTTRNNGVWFSWTCPLALNGQTIQVDTFRSRYDTLLAVYTGTCGALVEVGSSEDDTLAPQYQSRVQFVATTGVTYRFFVTSYGDLVAESASYGTLSLQVTHFQLLPPADTCGAAMAIASLPSYLFVDARTAVTLGTEPIPSYAYDRADPTTRNQPCWFTWTCPADLDGHVVDLRTLGSGYDTLLSVWTGTCGALREVGSCEDFVDQDDSYSTSRVAFRVTGGVTYTVLVTSYADISGEPEEGGTLRFEVTDLGVLPRPKFIVCEDDPEHLAAYDRNGVLLWQSWPESDSDYPMLAVSQNRVVVQDSEFGLSTLDLYCGSQLRRLTADDYPEYNVDYNYIPHQFAPNDGPVVFIGDDNVGTIDLITFEINYVPLSGEVPNTFYVCACDGVNVFSPEYISGPTRMTKTVIATGVTAFVGDDPVVYDPYAYTPLVNGGMAGANGSDGNVIRRNAAAELLSVVNVDASTVYDVAQDPDAAETWVNAPDEVWINDGGQIVRRINLLTAQILESFDVSSVMDDVDYLCLVPQILEEDTFEETDGLVSQPVGLQCMIDRQGTSRVFAEVDLNDPAWYENGYKAPRILSFNRVTRGLSDKNGQLEHLGFGAVHADTDYFWRGSLADNVLKYLTNRPIYEKIIDDENRRLQLPWRMIANGFVSDYSALPDLKFQVLGTDWLKSKYSRTKQGQAAWQPLITLADFPDAAVDVLNTPAPIIYGSVGLGGAQSETGTAAVQNVVITPDARPAAPTGFTAAWSAGGGLFGDFRDIPEGWTLYYAVSAVVGGIESDFAYASAVANAGGGHVDLAWDAYGGATEIRVYVGLASDFLQFSQLTTGLGGGATTLVDATGGTRTGVNVLDVWSLGLRMNVTYYVLALLADGQYTQPGQAQMIYTPITTLDRRRDMTVSWDAYPDATGYRILRHVSFYANWAPRFDLQFNVGSGTLFVDDVNNNEADIEGGYANAPDIQIPSGLDIAGPITGQVKAIFVGTELISGTRYKRLLIARHAVKKIGRIDVSVELQGEDRIFGRTSSFSQITEFGTQWFSPDETGWLFPDRYRDINGRRYTLLYTTVDPLPQSILVDVDGVEEVGDGSGALIERLAQQAKHFARNFLAPDAIPDTLWLTTCPTFEAFPSLGLVDESSFDAVDLASEVRLDLSGVGYTGGGVIGANGEAVAGEDALSRFCVSLDADSYFNRKGQLAITMEPAIAPTAPIHLDDVINIVAGTLSITDQVTSEFFNVLRWQHTRDYTGVSKGGWWAAGELVNALSVERYEQEIPSSTLQGYFLRNTSTNGRATIADVLGRRLIRYADPRRLITFSVPFSGITIEPGDVFQLTTRDGIDVGGWTRRYIRAQQHSVDIDHGQIGLTAYDVPYLNVPDTDFIGGGGGEVGGGGAPIGLN